MTFQAASHSAGWRPRNVANFEASDWDNPSGDRSQRRPDLTIHERAEREEREPNDRGERTSRRRARTERSSEPLGLVSRSDESDGPASGTRFYLEIASPVVDAPSIGPKMAEKLAKFGIITIGDFLNRPAQWISDKLGDSKLTAETIQTWQAQSSLMCQVPGLRGHDAQLLVGCDIKTPEQIRGYSPAGLLAVVGPFAESREGQRMLRSANPPDLEEVQDWINWTSESRQLRAA